MSRSSSPQLGRRIAAALAAVAAILLSAPGTAYAETTPGPVKDLQTGVASLDGTVVIQGTKKGANARIDATVLFGKDSAKLRPDARDRIRQVADDFARRGQGKVRVTGYTDDLGPADHGLRLSMRRAGAVADTLADLLPARGYPMTAIGKGEQDPAVPNTSEANRRKNRRVVITLDLTDPAKAGAGTGAGAPTGQPQPMPQRTSASALPEPATPSASAAPPQTPGPATPTATPADTTEPTSGPPPTAETTPPAGAPADTARGRSRFLDPVFLSNMFLALILLAGAVLVLLRLRRPDQTDPTPAVTPGPPPPPPGQPGAVRGPGGSDPAPTAGPSREDGPRRSDPSPGPDQPLRAPGLTTRLDLHAPSSRIGLEFTPAPHPSSPAGHPHPSSTSSAAAAGDLDADVRAWFSDRCELPRLSLLGPVTVRAHGAPIARRRPFYTELLTFLALRPHGATPDQVADAFSLTPARVRNDIKVLRDWLGTNPRTGRRHLPDARDTAAARARGMAVYQVEGVLVDLHLFNRLVKRAGAAGPGGLADLDQALRLVRGRPFDQLRPHGWEWLYEGDRVDLHAEAAVQRVSDLASALRGRTRAAYAPASGQVGQAAC